MVMDIILLMTCAMVLQECHGLTKEQQNVCTSETTGELYCCFNFEYDNGSCIECDMGFISDRGRSCLPCDDGLYGYKCLQICKCNNIQKCDNIVGCLDIWNTTEQRKTELTEEIQETEFNLKTTQEEFHISTVKNDKEQPVQHTVIWSNTTVANKPTGISEGELFVTKDKNNMCKVKIVIIVGVFLAYILIVHIVCFLIYKKIKNHRIMITNGNVYDEIGTVHYNAVSILPITVPESPTSIRNSEAPPRIDVDLYLNTEDNIQEIESDKTDTSSESNHDSVVLVDNEEEIQMQQSVTIRDSDGYEHPYTPLIPPIQNEHMYNVCLVTLESLSEESDQADSSVPANYINLQI